MKKILVLCSGNSCRSQMAEGYLKYYATGRAEYFSAGLQDRGVNPLTVEVMAEDNIDISTNHSKTYHRFQKQPFDYLITVCDEAYQQLPKGLSAEHHVHFSIPDPDRVNGTLEERREAFRQIRETVKKNFLKFIGRELPSVTEAMAS